MKSTLPLTDYNHVYLYAKNHYKQTDAIKDLQIILAKRSDIPVEYYTKQDVISTLAFIVFKHLDERKFTQLISDTFTDQESMGLNFSETAHVNTLVRKMLFVLYTVVCRKNYVNELNKGELILNLGKADKNILPLSK